MKQAKQMKYTGTNVDNASTCATCGKVLAECKTIWACGPLFCSEDCGVEWAKGLYMDDEYDSEDELNDMAAAYFHDIAEECDLETIGIEEEIWTAYAPEHNITSIFRSASEGGECFMTEFIGFYVGEPDEETTEVYVQETSGHVVFHAKAGTPIMCVPHTNIAKESIKRSVKDSLLKCSAVATFVAMLALVWFVDNSPVLYTTLVVMCILYITAVITISYLL